MGIVHIVNDILATIIILVLWSGCVKQKGHYSKELIVVCLCMVVSIVLSVIELFA